MSRKPKVDVTQATTERNFITPIRAMNDYLLKPTDLADLRKFQRRSPYVDAPAITVYLRRDVETKALQVWKTFDSLQRELKKRKIQEELYSDSVLNVKKVLKEYSRKNDPDAQMKEELLRNSGAVVMSAVLINSVNCLFKGLACLYTGSHSLFAESIHSLADTCNQLILYFGIRKSIQAPNEEHPYGYHNARYIASLISGVGILCVGSGLSVYHGINGLLHPESIESLYWAYLILGGSLLSEGGTLMIAFNSIRKGAQRTGMSIREFIFRSSDPSVNVVFMEDAAAVLGVIIAGGCMGLTSYFDNPIYDSIGSLLVGGLLGIVASFIIYSNSGALVGRSIPSRKIEAINKCLENDVMVRAIYDVKATEIGNSMVRYKAEVDIDGIQLTRRYLDTVDLEVLLKDMQNLKTIEDVESFMLKHGENIVDILGAEVDRMEKEMKKQHPQLRHVDLEVLYIEIMRE
ncbi:zinc transporter-like protein [Leptotrombidium deliense]|uniref:Proton-coupled zinc antiporter SLC30A9, mitochondrial n=1 Tax=Leptotrombidium deliense TaxID=299467 RepID=A0A443S807_9ACAR|nr:zinc transporter-like protein [Leptotrombidium deliense]